MNTTNTNENVASKQTITDRCVQSCKKLAAGIEQARNRIATEFQESLGSHGQLIQRALNEAEALAWQTEFPQLFFPTLAMEKVQAVATWRTRLQTLRQSHSVFAEAT